MTQTPLPSDTTPFNEQRALKKKLSGITVTASNYPQGMVVPVHLGLNPDFELRNASYPGIYITYANVSRAPEREVRGGTNLQYAPPGKPTDVQVPADFEDKDSTAKVDWGEDGFDRLTSPYTIEDHPVPYNLDYNVTVLTRNHEQMFHLIHALQGIDRIPARFGGLEVPEDGTIRTLELLGGPETGTIRDEDGKRIVQTLYSVRVAAELDLYEVQQVQRVTSVNFTVLNLSVPYL